MFLDDFVQEKGIKRESFSFNMALVIEIAIRLDQRRDYYHYFHSKPENITRMSQAKNFALLSYWVIKYKPFVQARDEAQKFYKERKCSINELIALSIIERDIFSLPGVDCDKVKRVFDDMKTSLLHTFMHTDVTKESMLQLILSLETAFKA